MRFRDLRPAASERLKTRLMALKKTIGLEASGNDIPSSIQVKKSGDLPLPPSALAACLLRALAQKALVQNGFEATALQAEKTAARGFWSEVQRVYEKRICTSLPSSLRIAWNGVLKPRHFLGVRLAVRTMSWISSSDTLSMSL